MMKKIIYVLLFFIAFLTVFCCSTYAANVLIVSEENVVHGKTVAEMLGKIAPDNFTVEERTIANNRSLAQAIVGITANGKTYDSVIIQLPYESITSGDASITDCVNAVKTLYAQLESTENTQYFICTPAGKISNYEQEAQISDEAVKMIIKELTTIKISSIPVFETLKSATDKSLAVYSNDKLTTLGDLLVACTYSNSLGNKVSNLSSYTGLNSAEVTEVVNIANGIGLNTTDTTEVVTTNASNTTENDKANTTDTTNNSNTTNTTDTTNTSNTATTTETKSTDETTDDAGNLVVSDITPGFAGFMSNREPRLRYSVESEYVYIEVRDIAGVACEFPSGSKGQFPAEKSLQPKIYHYDNDKRGAEIVNVKRPKEANYKKERKRVCL